MRAGWLVFGLCFGACGPTAPHPGTWKYEVDATVTTSKGTETKKGTFDLELAASSVADLVVWRLGGCNVPLAIKGQVAEMGTRPPTCGVSTGIKMPLLEEIGVTPKMLDQLEVRAARFEVLTDGKMKTRFEYKLFTDLKDARVGPVVAVDTPDGKHGTRATK